MIRVQPLTKPVDLTGAKNGYLLGEFLEDAYPGGDVLHHLAARAYQAMYAKAKSHDVDLGITDGYRPYATQERLFRERYLDHYNPLRTSTSRKFWQDRWWYKRWGVATAAVPGTSNHGWGLAVDIHTAGLGSITRPGPKLRWLDEFADDYGFSHELLPEEPWHVRYYRGDDIPGPVLAYEAAINRPPDPIPVPVPLEDDVPHYLVKPNNSDRQYVTDFSTYKRHVPRGDLAGPLGLIGAWRTDHGNAFVVEPQFLDWLPEA